MTADPRTRRQLHDVVVALMHLPEKCRYHGADIIGRDSRYSGACCATGEPSLARQRAFDAIAVILDLNGTA